MMDHDSVLFVGVARIGFTKTSKQRTANNTIIVENPMKLLFLYVRRSVVVVWSLAVL